MACNRGAASPDLEYYSSTQYSYTVQDPRKLREFFYALTWMGPQPEAWVSKRAAAALASRSGPAAGQPGEPASPSLPLAAIDAPPFALTRPKYTQLLANALEEISTHAPELADPSTQLRSLFRVHVAVLLNIIVHVLYIGVSHLC